MPSCSRPDPRSGRPRRSCSAPRTATPTGRPQIDGSPVHPGNGEVTVMTAIAITGMGLTGVLRMTWVQDNLAHVLDHSHTDETSGTWTGQAGPGHGLALGAEVDDATLRHPGRRERDRRPHLGSPRRPHHRTRSDIP